MWTIRTSDEYERRRKRLAKDRPRELKFVLGNYAAFVAALNEGARSQDVRAGYIHPEPGGFLAITEKGAGKNAAPVRLYVYPDDAARTLYVVTLGNKKTQAGDIQFCKDSLPLILSEGQTDHVQDEDLP